MCFKPFRALPDLIVFHVSDSRLLFPEVVAYKEAVLYSASSSPGVLMFKGFEGWKRACRTLTLLIHRSVRPIQRVTLRYNARTLLGNLPGIDRFIDDDNMYFGKCAAQERCVECTSVESRSTVHLAERKLHSHQQGQWFVRSKQNKSSPLSGISSTAKHSR